MKGHSHIMRHTKVELLIGHKQRSMCHFDLCVVLLPNSSSFILRVTEELVILWSLIIFHTRLNLQEVKGFRYRECYGLILFITLPA